MSTENLEPIKTLDDWIRRVKELEQKLESIDPLLWPFPYPSTIESDEHEPPLGGPLP